MHHSALHRWLQLTLSWKLSASTLNKLLTHAGSVEALCCLPHNELEALGLSASAWPVLIGWQQGKVDTALQRLVDELPAATQAPAGANKTTT